MMHRLTQLLILLVMVLVVPSTLMACPTCKQGLVDASNNPNLVRGYGWSIMFMMGITVLDLGGLGRLFLLRNLSGTSQASQRGGANSLGATTTDRLAAIIKGFRPWNLLWRRWSGSC